MVGVLRPPQEFLLAIGGSAAVAMGFALKDIAASLVSGLSVGKFFGIGGSVLKQLSKPLLTIASVLALAGVRDGAADILAALLDGESVRTSDPEAQGLLDAVRHLGAISVTASDSDLAAMLQIAARPGLGDAGRAALLDGLADGLALGKGVTVAGSLTQARQAVQSLMVDRDFGDAGDSVIIEDCLFGQEVSAFAISDGRSLKMLPFARDFKQCR